MLPLIEADGNKGLKGFTSFWHLLLTLAQKEIVEGKQQPVDDTRTKESSRVSVHLKCMNVCSARCVSEGNVTTRAMY